MGRGGVLLVKGLKSMWRQAAPIVRNTLQGALRRIIMQVTITREKQEIFDSSYETKNSKYQYMNSTKSRKISMWSCAFTHKLAVLPL